MAGLTGYGAAGQQMGLGGSVSPDTPPAPPGWANPEGGDGQPISFDKQTPLNIGNFYQPGTKFTDDRNGQQGGDSAVVATNGPGTFSPTGYIPPSAYTHDPNTFDLGQHLNGQVDPYDSYSVDAIKAMHNQQQQGAYNGGVYSAQRPGMNAVQQARMQQGYQTQDPNNAVLAAYNQPNGQSQQYGMGGYPMPQQPQAPQTQYSTDKFGNLYDPTKATLDATGKAVGNSTGVNVSQLTPDQEYQRAWGIAPAQSFTPGATVDRGTVSNTGRERGGA